jgi:hypothetical protein
VSAPISCFAGRPINRYLLASLIRELERRGARLIVIDAVLEADSSAIDPAENEALASALATARVPVVLVDEAEYSAHTPSHTDYVHLRGNGLRLQGPSLFESVALPTPGEPLRRYPRCYRADDADHWIPSTPFVAGELAASRQTAGCPPATERSEGDFGEAPRIEYEFPSLSEAGVDEDADPSDSATLRYAPYHRVYTRCLAANFWPDVASADRKHCADREAYEGRIVIIGASDHVQRDLHTTPLGLMAGAEVIINALSSFARAPYQPKQNHWAGEGRALLGGSLLWFLFYCVKGFLHRHDHEDTPEPPGLAVGRAILISLAFVVTLFAVTAFSVWIAYGSFAILVSVLSIAVEQYVEVISKCLLAPIEKWSRRFVSAEE